MEYIPNESPWRRRVRSAKYWLRHEIPWRLRITFGRLKLSEFGLSPLPVLKARIQTEVEYHEQHCDLSDFTGYCPRTGRYWSLPVNTCPQCGLSLAKVRGYKLLPGQVIFIQQSQRMTGPIPRPLGQVDLAQTPPRDHIFPPMVAACPVPPF